jgi:hypothetical protein
MQVACLNGPPDGAIAEAQPLQLTARDDSVLARRQSG